MTESADLFSRDGDGRCHVVALSGGKDSTAMALRLAEVEPRSYVYICTPTGDELPAMFEHWRRLGKLLRRPIYPITAGTLKSLCEHERALPNFRMRFCTKQLKVRPFKAFLLRAMPVVSYVGLRADEDLREGIDLRPAHYGGSVALSAPGQVEQRYPLREWGWDKVAVVSYLDERGVDIPARTDCARCFFQRIDEWWTLWRDYPQIFADAVGEEDQFGHTFRTPGRDTWPVGLRDLGKEFEHGRIPRRDPRQRDLFRDATCRVCTL